LGGRSEGESEAGDGVPCPFQRLAGARVEDAVLRRGSAHSLALFDVGKPARIEYLVAG